MEEAPGSEPLDPWVVRCQWLFTAAIVVICMGPSLCILTCCVIQIVRKSKQLRSGREGKLPLVGREEEADHQTLFASTITSHTHVEEERAGTPGFVEALQEAERHLLPKQARNGDISFSALRRSHLHSPPSMEHTLL